MFWTFQSVMIIYYSICYQILFHSFIHFWGAEQYNEKSTEPGIKTAGFMTWHILKLAV